MSAYLIWSNQQRGFWRASGFGYTDRIEEAGRFAETHARQIVSDSTVGGQLVHTRTNLVTGETYQSYDEVVVLAPESEAEQAREHEHDRRELGRLRRYVAGRTDRQAIVDAAIAYRHAVNDADSTAANSLLQDIVTAVDGALAEVEPLMVLETPDSLANAEPLITCLYDRRPHVADAECVDVTPATTNDQGPEASRGNL